MIIVMVTCSIYNEDGEGADGNAKWTDKRDKEIITKYCAPFATG